MEDGAIDFHKKESQIRPVAGLVAEPLENISRPRWPGHSCQLFVVCRCGIL